MKLDDDNNSNMCKYKIEEANEKISSDIPNRIEGRGSC